MLEGVAVNCREPVVLQESSTGHTAKLQKKKRKKKAFCIYYYRRSNIQSIGLGGGKVKSDTIYGTFPCSQ